jgi:hypothetical protein
MSRPYLHGGGNEPGKFRESANLRFLCLQIEPSAPKWD